MTRHDSELLHRDLTQLTIGTFFHVYNRLGAGFLESVYRRALANELRKRGVEALEEHPITVYYERSPVGFFRADLFVAGLVVLEIKAAETIARGHVAQLINYLRASNVEVGLLLNFGPTASFKRVVFTHQRGSASG